MSKLLPRCLFLLGILSLTRMATPAVAEEVKPREWKVQGVDRTGLVYAPTKAKESPTPVVFVFHGHGGSSRNAHRSFALDTAWPEAISVYLQGLNTPGKLTDPEGKKTGWQSGPGDQGDRDLLLFDAVLESLRKDYKVDEQRIYSTGHSNGGGFTYLLWAERGNVFSAMGPSAAAAIRVSDKLKPKPMFHIASENDTLVKYDWQKTMIGNVRKINKTGEATPWKHDKKGTLYPSADGNDVVVYLHEGGHKFPGKEAVTAMVKFFQEHPKK